VRFVCVCGVCAVWCVVCVCWSVELMSNSVARQLSEASAAVGEAVHECDMEAGRGSESPVSEATISRTRDSMVVLDRYCRGGVTRRGDAEGWNDVACALGALAKCVGSLLRTNVALAPVATESHNPKSDSNEENVHEQLPTSTYIVDVSLVNETSCHGNPTDPFGEISSNDLSSHGHSLGEFSSDDVSTDADSSHSDHSEGRSPDSVIPYPKFPFRKRGTKRKRDASMRQNTYNESPDSNASSPNPVPKVTVKDVWRGFCKAFGVQYPTAKRRVTPLYFKMYDEIRPKILGFTMKEMEDKCGQNLKYGTSLYRTVQNRLQVKLDRDSKVLVHVIRKDTKKE
jgi:hypothetical protein